MSKILIEESLMKSLRFVVVTCILMVHVVFLDV